MSTKNLSSSHPPDIAGAMRTVASRTASQRYKPQTVHASIIGEPCERRLYYEQAEWQNKPTMDEGLCGVLLTGTILHPIIAGELNRIGMAQEPQWRLASTETSIDDRMIRRSGIGGTIDGILQVRDAGRWHSIAVADTKTCSPHVYGRIDSVDDLHAFHFTAKWRAQLTVYGLGFGIEQCALILVNKCNLYDLKFISWDLDYGYAEELLQRAERVNEHVEAEVPPDRNEEMLRCGRCPFVQICQPSVHGGDSTSMCLDDPEVEGLLDERSNLKDAKRRFDAVDKTLKQRLPEMPYISIGNHIVKGTMRHRKGFTTKGTDYWHREYGRIGAGSE